MFSTYNEEKQQNKRLKALLEKFSDIHPVIQQYHTKKIIPDFQRLTQYMKDLNIQRTSKLHRKLLQTNQSPSNKENT